MPAQQSLPEQNAHPKRGQHFLKLVTAKGNDCKPAAFGERSEGPKARPKFVLFEPKASSQILAPQEASAPKDASTAVNARAERSPKKRQHFLKLVTAKGSDCKPAAFGERSE